MEIMTALFIQTIMETVIVIRDYGYVIYDKEGTILDSNLELDDEFINNEEDNNNIQYNDDPHYNYDEENDDEEQNNDKIFWLLVGLGAVWSVIAYIFCCRCCH